MTNAKFSTFIKLYLVLKTNFHSKKDFLSGRFYCSWGQNIRLYLKLKLPFGATGTVWNIFWFRFIGYPQWCTSFIVPQNLGKKNWRVWSVRDSHSKIPVSWILIQAKKGLKSFRASSLKSIWKGDGGGVLLFSQSSLPIQPKVFSPYKISYSLQIKRI